MGEGWWVFVKLGRMFLPFGGFRGLDFRGFGVSFFFILVLLAYKPCFLGSSVVPFCPFYFRVPLSKLNSRKRVTLVIMMSLVRSLAFNRLEDFKTLHSEMRVKPHQAHLNVSPRGSICTTIMESGPQNHNRDGLLGPNSIMVAYIWTVWVKV